MPGPAVSKPFDWCGAVTATCRKKDKYRMDAGVLQLYHRRKRETSSTAMPKLQPCERTAKEMSRNSSEGILLEEVLL
jgi:hypothetical protein